MPRKASPDARRPRLYIDVTPEFRRHVKAAAALEDMTASEFILACVKDRLEADDDLQVAMDRLLEEEYPWEEVKRRQAEKRRALSGHSLPQR